MMRMKCEMVNDEPYDQTPYPITDMKVGDWAVIELQKTKKLAFDPAMFGCAVTKLQENRNCVFTNTGQRDMTCFNYLVRNFKHGECLKIRRA